jgi:Flp pilus assembly protein TadB
MREQHELKHIPGPATEEEIARAQELDERLEYAQMLLERIENKWPRAQGLDDHLEYARMLLEGVINEWRVLMQWLEQQEQ